MNGIINVYKEKGYTSHDVVARDIDLREAFTQEDITLLFSPQTFTESSVKHPSFYEDVRHTLCYTSFLQRIQAKAR